MRIDDGFHNALEEILLREKEFDPEGNIIAFGFGRKLRSGIPMIDYALRVYVKRKIVPWNVPFSERSRPLKASVPMRSDLKASDVFNVEGMVQRFAQPRAGEIITDIIESPDVFRLQAYRASRFGELCGGISIGLELDSTGTLGGIFRNKTGTTARPGREFYLLTAGHVLGRGGRARTSTVCQPGADDCTAYGLTPSSQKVADVVTVVEPAYSISSPKSFKVDAGIARPRSGVDALEMRIMECGAIIGVKDATEDMPVRKMGRTTGLTYGRVTDTRFSLVLEDPTNRAAKAILSDQIATTAMSREGDSGSIVIDEGNRVVGLLVAGTDDRSIVTPIQAVFDELDLTLF